MEKEVQRIIAKLKADAEVHLNALGDFPKADSFEHGIAVGVYRGLRRAIQHVEEVLSSEDEEEKRQ